MEMKILSRTRLYWTIQNCLKVLKQLNPVLWQCLNFIFCFLLGIRSRCVFTDQVNTHNIPIIMNMPIICQPYECYNLNAGNKYHILDYCW